MSDEWKVGDLAECIVNTKNGRWIEATDPTEEADGPSFGEVNRVSWVGFDKGIHALAFEPRWPEKYSSRCFRKLKPPRADEACEDDFVKLMDRIRPKVDA
jgi:hypothetical protein